MGNIDGLLARVPDPNSHFPTFAIHYRGVGTGNGTFWEFAGKGPAYYVYLYSRRWVVANYEGNSHAWMQEMQWERQEKARLEYEVQQERELVMEEEAARKEVRVGDQVFVTLVGKVVRIEFDKWSNRLAYSVDVDREDKSVFGAYCVVDREHITKEGLE